MFLPNTYKTLSRLRYFLLLPLFIVPILCGTKNAKAQTQNTTIAPANSAYLYDQTFSTSYNFGVWASLYDASGTFISSGSCGGGGYRYPYSNCDAVSWTTFSGASTTIPDGTYNLISYASGLPADCSTSSTYSQCFNYVYYNIAGAPPWGYGDIFDVSISSGLATFVDMNESGYGVATSTATSTPPSTPPSAGCSGINSILTDPVGTLTNWACSIFIPSPDQQADLGASFISQWTNISNKAPFGYYTLISGQINSFSTSTPSSSATIILNSSSTGAISGVLDPLNTGLQTILWIIFGFWVFHRFRNMDYS